MKRIGVLGGTFNPIHNTHMHLGRLALEEFLLDQILLVPAGDPYFKSEDPKKSSELLSAKYRLAMTEAAVSEEACFRVSDIEVKREGKSYTADTLKELDNDDVRLFFIMGEDSFRSLHLWHAVDEILEHAALIVAKRPMENQTICEQTLREQDAQLKEIRRGFYQQYPKAEIFFLHMPQSTLSSTEIRRLARQGQYDTLAEFVPSGVLAYIKEQHLYQ